MTSLGWPGSSEWGPKQPSLLADGDQWRDNGENLLPLGDRLHVHWLNREGLICLDFEKNCWVIIWWVRYCQAMHMVMPPFSYCQHSQHHLCPWEHFPQCEWHYNSIQTSIYILHLPCPPLFGAVLHWKPLMCLIKEQMKVFPSERLD